MSKINSIEFIRSIAAMLVVLFHIQTVFGVAANQIPFGGIFSAGHRGVDLFFVLSGFIITHAHRKDFDKPHRLKNYIFNRFTRIYPAVWIMSAFALIVYFIFPLSAEKSDKLYLYPIIASFFLLPQASTPLVNVTWTLVYEMFFYVVFSIFIINFYLGFVIFLIWQSTIVYLIFSDLNVGSNIVYINPLCLEFALGMACAYLLQVTKKESISSFFWLSVTVGGGVSFVLGMVLEKDYSFVAILCPLGAAMLIIGCVRLEEFEWINIPNLFLVLGGASFSIYIVHYSVIQIVAIIFRKIGLPSSNTICLLFFLIGIISGLMFDILVDKPLQKLLRSIKERYL